VIGKPRQAETPDARGVRKALIGVGRCPVVPHRSHGASVPQPSAG